MGIDDLTPNHSRPQTESEHSPPVTGTNFDTMKDILDTVGQVYPPKYRERRQDGHMDF